MADETTPAPASDAEIREIAERAAKATPGPWSVAVNGDELVATIRHAPGFSGYERLATLNSEYGNRVADAAFIAAARTDIPRLLATLDAYHEVRGQALADIARLAGERDTARRLLAARDARLAALERENAVMREIVAAVADFDSDDAYDGAYKCHWCNYSYMMPPDDATHDPDCPIVTARALLATLAPGTTGATAAGEEGES